MLSRALWQLVKRCLIPAAAVVAEAKAHSEPEYPRVCRPSELPIYIPEPVCNVKHKVVEAPGILESTIRDTRETITKYSDEVKAYQRVTQEHISKSKENIQLKKDDPPLELPSLPKLPSSLTEVWTSVKSTFVSDAPETKAPQEQVPKSK
ncbi:unnamed protein product [Acanthoscelides obtectus]|uniref:Uncharacterized protein n=1 Tax=Acanthoscelides obtectus TaxID=200917 RepID=A0A9P0L6U0_ACAOB|nr:unnamed protein product [Acanthoscelides obtectus]CAK1636518.1 hypothetical protein AOBTE_LOCUS9871 [Acanthoscelides obtectus]